MPTFNRKSRDSTFQELVAQHGRQVYNIALFTVQDQVLAADITQEVFIRIYRYLDRFRGEAKLSTWIYRITRNCCLNQLKREHRYRVMEDINPEHPAADTPESNYLQGEQRELVRTAVGKLPPHQRLAISLYYFHERSYQEVAELMELPLNTIKSHLRRARLALAELLQCEVRDEI